MNATISTSSGRLDVTAKRIAVWIGIAIGVMTLAGAAGRALGNVVVKPKEMTEVTEKLEDMQLKQEVTTAATTRLSLRVDTLRDQMNDFATLAEVLVIDVCLRNRDNPYAMRRLNCEEFVQ